MSTAAPKPTPPSGKRIGLMNAAREALDSGNRHHALALAAESHHHWQPDVVLSVATQYLAWLRQPTPAATLALRESAPIPK